MIRILLWHKEKEMADYKSSYTGEQIDAGIGKANTSVQPESLAQGLATKQDTLVSGTNIKTINNTSLLGSGNIDIQGGSGGMNIYSFNESDLGQSVLSYIVNNNPDMLRITTQQSKVQDYYKGQDGEYYCLIDDYFMTLKITGTEGSYTPTVKSYYFDDFTHVSGIDDGIDWTSITIGGVTRNISNIKKYSATFDTSQGSPTLSQTDLEQIYNNKPDVINLSAGTTTTIGYKTRVDSDEYKVWYSTTVVEQSTPTVYIITIEYDYANSQYIFTMDDYSLTSNA